MEPEAPTGRMKAPAARASPGTGYTEKYRRYEEWRHSRQVSLRVFAKIQWFLNQSVEIIDKYRLNVVVKSN